MRSRQKHLKAKHLPDIVRFWAGTDKIHAPSAGLHGSAPDGWGVFCCGEGNTADFALLPFPGTSVTMMAYMPNTKKGKGGSRNRHHQCEPALKEAHPDGLRPSFSGAGIQKNDGR